MMGGIVLLSKTVVENSLRRPASKPDCVGVWNEKRAPLEAASGQEFPAELTKVFDERLGTPAAQDQDCFTAPAATCLPGADRRILHPAGK
jgi:hypothetical protein